MNSFQKVQYMFLSLCLVLFIIVASQNIPDPRYAQASALVDAKLYFFGGKLKSGFVTSGVWYLDLESLSNATMYSWHRGPSIPVAYYSGTSCVSVIDNSTVFLIGGIMYTPDTPNLNFDSKIYIFDPNKPQWNLPRFINGNVNFVMHNNIQAVINKDDRIFIYGGQNFTSNNSSNTMYNDVNLLLATDHNNIIWETLLDTDSTSTPLPPTGIPPTAHFIQYTATLLSNGLIVYIGGIQETKATYAALITELKLFDTNAYWWSSQNVNGDPIESRAGHTAVLAQNGIIIIYGGYANRNNTLYNKVTPDVAILDTATWTWSAPTISQANAPPLLALHSAVLYGNYMIVAFGLNVSGSTGLIPDNNSLTVSNNIYILDIQNYSWVTTLPAITTTIPTSTTTIPAGNQLPDIRILQIEIGIGVGGAILVGILSFFGYWYYQRRHQDLNSNYFIYKGVYFAFILSF